jgi:hypothetical protein
MSLTITSISRSAQDRILAAVDVSHSKTTSAVESVSGTMTRVLPDRLLAVTSLPAKVGAPSPQDAVDLTWGFAQELIGRQRTFADDLVDATTPRPDDGA